MPAKKKDSAEIGARKAPGGRKNPEGVPFTPLTAKKAQEASVRARNMRKQIRAQMLDTLVNNMDFGNEILQAYKTRNIDRMTLIEKCIEIVGLRFKDSEDAVQKLDVEANEKVNATVRFVLGKRPETPPQG